MMPKPKSSTIFLLFLVSTGGWLSAASETLAQSSQGTPRKIISDDFTKNRPGTQTSNTKGSEGQASSGVRAKPKQPKRTYQVAASSTATTHSKISTNTPEQLGITIWRLRPANANDTGARMLVRDKSWVPERVAAGTSFREGDQLRLSIESAQAGYLYVVDRELLMDGSTGPAMLIYPWAGVQMSNQVGPGKLIDIPAQDDSPSYFTARRSSPNHAGEILTVIVTSSPLDLPVSDKPLPISNADLAHWEKLLGGPTEHLEMEGGAGETWTTQEQQAASSKGGRQLTREDPAPQTIYRVFGIDKKGLLVNVRLLYGR
ncbi:MAG TPA: hypothetical protein VJR02_23625 [Pyrinomonadaceae bacterium]|nr:hypothetical protein [Pyrinomonadaceae bacterium]